MRIIDPDRLKLAMARASINQSQLADAVGLKQPSIGRLLSGETKTTRWLDQIATALETSPAYLCGEVSTPEPVRDAEGFDDRFLMVPQVETGMLARRADLPAQEATGDLVPFPRQWVATLVADDSANLFVATAEGDAMIPTLLDGDAALVDADQVELVEQDRLFCIAHDGVGMIRRLRRLPGGLVRIASDNPAMPAIDVDADDFEMIGRVIWIGRSV